MSKSKSNQPSRRQNRKIRFQQIMFGLIAFIIIASFIVSMLTF